MMRKVVMALVAGMLLVGLSGMTAHAEDSTGAGLPVMSVKALQKVVKPGGTVTVELYVTGVSDLGVFQWQVESKGGEKGTVSFKDAVIDINREDYVYHGMTSLPAVDKQGIRAGAVVMGGVGKDVRNPEYMGTVTFAASADAAGTFDLNIATNQHTFLRDSAGRPIVFKVGDPVQVTVGEIPQKQPRKRDGR